MPYNNLLTECHIETMLVEMLGYRAPNHQGNNSDVLKAMKTTKLSRQKAVGFIDDDKIEPKGLDEFEVVEQYG